MAALFYCQQQFPRIVSSVTRENAEAALAHVVGDQTERAYRRGDALERRRELMEAWEAHCLREPDPEHPVIRLFEHAGRAR